MIEVEGLSKSYGNFAAVRDVSFSAKKGDIVGFLGPNGAGKTTTLRMLTTFMPASSGTARVAGYDISSHGDQVRKRIGYLPENPPLYNEMTVAEYLTFVAEIKGIPRKQLKQRVAETVERCFLAEVRNKLCQHLSRGYRQRVGLAQAIIHDPEVVILDEPTSGLDPRQIIDIRKLIASLAKERTVILSTHILPEVSMVCNRVVIINRGRIVLQSDLDSLLRERSLEEVFLECVSQDEQHQVQEAKKSEAA
jgi:ABC-2 type transport system ATP-binding protein